MSLKWRNRNAHPITPNTNAINKTSQTLNPDKWLQHYWNSQKKAILPAIKGLRKLQTREQK